jgi:hypothetical protein
MKRLIISAFASICLFAASAMQQSASIERSAQTVTMPSLQELHTTAGADKLPSEHSEDMSLVFPP